MANTKDALKLTQAQLAEQQARTASSDQALAQLREDADAQRKAMAGLQLAFDVTQTQLEAAEKLSQQRLTSVQRLTSANDDAQLQHAETVLVQRRAKKASKRLNDKYKEEVERAKQLEAVIANMARAASEAAEHLVTVQNQSAEQARKAKAQISEVRQ